MKRLLQTGMGLLALAVISIHTCHALPCMLNGNDTVFGVDVLKCVCFPHYGIMEHLPPPDNECVRMCVCVRTLRSC